MRNWKMIMIITAVGIPLGLGAFTAYREASKPVAMVAGQSTDQPSSGPQATELITPVAPPAPTQPTEQTAPVAQAPAPKPTPKPAPAVSPAPRPAPAPAPAPAHAPAPAACTGGFTQQFYCLLNEYRASKKLRALSPSSALAQVSLTHSQWMSTTGTFSHTGLNGSRLGDRCAAAGITCRAENLANGARSAQNLLDMWKNSPGHNANLLGPYSTAGLGLSGPYATLLLN